MPAGALGFVPLPSLAVKPEHSWSFARHPKQWSRWKKPSEDKSFRGPHSPSEAPHQCHANWSFRLCPFPRAKPNSKHRAWDEPLAEDPKTKSSSCQRNDLLGDCYFSWQPVGNTTSTEASGLLSLLKQNPDLELTIARDNQPRSRWRCPRNNLSHNPYLNPKCGMSPGPRSPPII